MLHTRTLLVSLAVGAALPVAGVTVLAVPGAADAPCPPGQNLVGVLCTPPCPPGQTLSGLFCVGTPTLPPPARPDPVPLPRAMPVAPTPPAPPSRVAPVYRAPVTPVQPRAPLPPIRPPAPPLAPPIAPAPAPVAPDPAPELPAPAPEPLAPVTPAPDCPPAPSPTGGGLLGLSVALS